MPLELKHIKSTDSTPELILDPTGIVKIKGRGIGREFPGLIKEVNGWIEEYVHISAEVTYVDIFCEYLNSYTTSFIVSVLRKLSSLELKGYKVNINWYYEDGDDDMLERGEFIASSLDAEFVFIRCHDRVLCN